MKIKVTGKCNCPCCDADHVEFRHCCSAMAAKTRDNLFFLVS
jgi:hypothetical protein